MRMCVASQRGQGLQLAAAAAAPWNRAAAALVGLGSACSCCCCCCCYYCWLAAPPILRFSPLAPRSAPLVASPWTLAAAARRTAAARRPTARATPCCTPCERRRWVVVAIFVQGLGWERQNMWLCCWGKFQQLAARPAPPHTFVSLGTSHRAPLAPPFVYVETAMERR